MSNNNPTAWAALRAQFPIFSRSPLGESLVYLDTAASAHAPQRVIDAMSEYRQTLHSNVHRGVHTLSQRATDQFEAARALVAAFIGARSPAECVFVRGATEGLNLVAYSFARPRLARGREILVTSMEHHANIVPWQLVGAEVGTQLTVVPIDSGGVLDLAEANKLLSRRPVLLAVTHVSNVLGTVNPLKELIALAHSYDVPVVVDGCQAVPHEPVDVVDLDADFYAFSAHKMYGPTGIGVLYGKKELLDAMPPFQGGGEMIQKVTFAATTFNEVPARFEAGTPAIAEAIGLGETIRFLQELDFTEIHAREQSLLQRARAGLSIIPGFHEIGTAPGKTAVLSFVIHGVHHHDLGTILDSQGIAVRVGHHCAQPLMERFSIEGCARASFSFYNTESEVDRFVSAVHEAYELLAPAQVRRILGS